jgi:hypothetical protein
METWIVKINLNEYVFTCREEAKQFARYWGVEFQ